MVLLFGLFCGSSAWADNGYKSVPAESADHATAPAPATAGTPGTPGTPGPQDAQAVAKASGLDLRVVAYDGSVNGELTVEVKNPGKTELTFSAAGLYFVPEGNADQAPQRLGAVGPMQIADGKAQKRVEQLKVPPGGSMKVKLDVFCIDSHRPAPTSKTGFSLGSKRLPAKLRNTIETRAKSAADQAGGYAAPAAKSRMQSEVWGARDADWVEVDGEGKQELGKKGGGGGPQQQRDGQRPRRNQRDRAPQVQEQRTSE